VRPVNIEEFYDADERRRESLELELGNEWRDASGHRFDLSYVVATGELYSMSAPEAEIYEDPFGDMVSMKEPADALTVEVLAVVPTADELHQLLDGWQDAMANPSSLEWVRERVRAYAPR